MKDLTTVDLMHQDLTGSLPEGLEPLLSKLHSRFGEALCGVVLYGSCRRMDDTSEGLVDLMAIVSSYPAVHGRGLSAVLNRLVPPNVYYLEARSDASGSSAEHIIRCKYIVITASQLQQRCSTGLDAYFWARFTQPCRMVWQRNPSELQAMTRCRVNAAERFARKAALLGPAELSGEAFWVRAIQASYGCELRPEAPAAAARLVAHDQQFWQQLTAAVAQDSMLIQLQHDQRNQYRIRLTSTQRLSGTVEWALRRVWGKTKNALRVLKAAGTFTNGLDYLVWKIERHSGIRVEPTERMRRHPRLAAWSLVFRLWREGAFR